MIHRIDALLRTENYSFLKVSPEEAGVYYQIENGVVKVIIGIHMHSNFTLTVEKLQVIQHNLRELFLHPQGKVPGCEENMVIYDVHMLTLLVSSQSNLAKELCAQCNNIWFVNSSLAKILIFENQPGDFYGIYDKLQNTIMDVPRGNAGEQYDMYENDACNGASGNTASGHYNNASRTHGYHLAIVNTGIVIINVIVFLILSFIGDVESGSFMVAHGGMYPSQVLEQGEWWRLFTSMFLHFGIAHLANNMVILFFTGDKLELAVGKIRYLIIYIGSGLCGGLLSMYMMTSHNDMAVSAGASGAIFGVIGALLWVVIRNRGRLGDLTTRGLLIMIILCLYFGFTSTGVDNWCHVGGLVGGFLLSLLLYRRKD